ncbi:putative uncharacterized protein DDB_G0288537 [Stomoxys calcitrans]|uniref:putative uncharacterized protein DDB_G0288537 n=1 Tax=Stomoxys calcitrans TaxID=35570 RepID=UPI0027E2C9B0|nr:putative uncharacterized protein DDB_G0288537 [Stomoxys calcitrans]
MANVMNKNKSKTASSQMSWLHAPLLSKGIKIHNGTNKSSYPWVNGSWAFGLRHTSLRKRSFSGQGNNNSSSSSSSTNINACPAPPPPTPHCVCNTGTATATAAAATTVTTKSTTTNRTNEVRFTEAATTTNPLPPGKEVDSKSKGSQATSSSILVPSHSHINQLHINHFEFPPKAHLVFDDDDDEDSCTLKSLSAPSLATTTAVALAAASTAWPSPSTSTKNENNTLPSSSTTGIGATGCRSANNSPKSIYHYQHHHQQQQQQQKHHRHHHHHPHHQQKNLTLLQQQQTHHQHHKHRHHHHHQQQQHFSQLHYIVAPPPHLAEQQQQQQQQSATPSATGAGTAIANSNMGRREIKRSNTGSSTTKSYDSGSATTNFVGKFTQSVRRIVQDVKDEGAPSGMSREEVIETNERLRNLRIRLEESYDTAKQALITLMNKYGDSKSQRNIFQRYPMLKIMIKDVIRLETQYWALIDIPRQEKQETVPTYVMRACSIMEKTQKSGEGVKTSAKLAEEAAEKRERLERLENMTTAQIEHENNQLINDLYRLLKKYLGLRHLIRVLKEEYGSSKLYPIFPRYTMLKDMIKGIMHDPDYMEISIPLVLNTAGQS